MASSLGKYWQLTKPRVVALIVFTAFIGMFLAVPAPGIPGFLPPWRALVFGSLGMALYRSRLAEAWSAGLDPAANDSAFATLGGALAAAAATGGTAGIALLQAARTAFTDAVQWSGIGGFAVVLAACLLAARLLRPGRPGPTALAMDEGAA